MFEREDDPPPECRLYLISPLDVAGGFPDRLARALDAAPVAAFQLRVKGVDQHEAARLAEEARLDPEFAEKFITFVVAEVVRHHEALARTTP